QWGRDTGFSRTSGNAAFDEYRQETLDRLEDEQKEFKDFLSKLKLAKDRAELDQFMAERRHADQAGGGGQDEAPQPNPA
ncbi:MAG: DUF2852 domain-containing protein, partial [Pseudomonadota bacterium]